MICYLWWPVLVQTDCWCGSLAVLPPTSVGSANGTVVGRWLVYIAVAPAAAGPRSGWILDDFGGASAGQ